VSDGSHVEHAASAEECIGGLCRSGARKDPPMSTAVEPASLFAASHPSVSVPFVLSPEKMKVLDNKVNAIVENAIIEAKKKRIQTHLTSLAKP